MTDRCPRTRYIVRRLADGAPLSHAEERHLAGCAVCGRARELVDGGDRALSQAAGALVGERVPRSVLSPAVLASPARPAPARRFTPLLAAAVILVAASVAGVAATQLLELRPQVGGPLAARGVDDRDRLSADLEQRGFSCGRPPKTLTRPVPLTGGRVCAREDRDGNLQLVVTIGYGSPASRLLTVQAYPLRPDRAGDPARARDFLALVAEMALPRDQADLARAAVTSLLAAEQPVCDCRWRLGTLGVRLVASVEDGYVLDMGPSAELVGVETSPKP